MADNYKVFRLADIKIPDKFRACHPNPGKLKAKLDALSGPDGDEKRKALSSLEVTSEGWLLDGYATYLAMKELGMDEVPCTVTDRRTTVFATHPGGHKWYQFLVSDRCGFLAPGDSVAAQTVNGIQRMVVKRVSSLPVSECDGLRYALNAWGNDSGKEGLA